MDKLKQLDSAATPGMWGQFSARYGPWQEQAKGVHHTRHDSSHDMSTVREDGAPKRVAHFTHANDAAFVEALVNAYRDGELVTRPTSPAEAAKVLLEDDMHHWDRSVAVASENARESALRDKHGWKVAAREAFRAALRAIADRG